MDGSVEEQLCGLTCDAAPGSSVISNCARVGPLARLPTSWAKAHTEVLVSICTCSPWYSHLPQDPEHVKRCTGSGHLGERQSSPAALLIPAAVARSAAAGGRPFLRARHHLCVRARGAGLGQRAV